MSELNFKKQDVLDAACKLGRFVNGGAIGYYAGGKTSEVMRKTLPNRIVEVVEKHKQIQLATSLAQSFVPGAGVAAMAAAVAAIWKMYYDINQILGIKISDNIGKSLTSAILTNFTRFGAQGVATAVSEGAKFIPFVGWIASAAITSVSSTAITYGSAYLYLNALTKMYEAEGKFNINYLQDELRISDNHSSYSDNYVYSVPVRYFYSDPVVEKVKSIIVEKLGVDLNEVVESASLKNDLGADSSDAVELIMEFENSFGIFIPDDEVDNNTTVGDVIKYIKNHT